MKNKKGIKILGIVIAAALLMQAGYAAYHLITTSLNDKVEAADSSTAGITGMEASKDAIKPDDSLKDETGSEISQEILDMIKESDPDYYTKNLNNYKQLLKDLDVHTRFKNEIERLIKKGKKLPDLFTAYSFLNDCYGSITELEKLVSEKESGKTWAAVFTAYNKSNPQFEPSNFDNAYLEKLLATPGVDHDDIMIADRVSQKTGAAFDAVINKKISGSSWRLVKAQYGIVNGLEKSPHLSLTREQLTKYTKQTGLDQKIIVGWLTTAEKLGVTADEILKLAKQGLSIEEVYSNVYEEKYY